MSTHASAAPTRPTDFNRWLRPKYLLFGFIGLMFAYVFVRFETFLFNPHHPEWEHIAPFKWWMLAHGVAGACALLLGPLQFSDRLRQRYLRLHRIIGRIYVGAVFIAAPMGLYIQYYSEKLGRYAPSFTWETAIQGGMWLLTTAIALAFILQGKVQQHRQWMTRSFGTGPLIFIEVRVILGLTGIHDPHGVEIVVWTCTACSIIVADLVLQSQELLQNRRAKLRRAAAAAAL